MVNMEFRLTSAISVEEVQQVGDDLAIVRAARTSSFGSKHGPNEGIEDQVGLIRFLMRHRHGSPFEHGQLTVRVHAPIKVWREWHRHRVGWSYSEESGRYKQLEPTFYLPPPQRPMLRPDGFRSANPDFAVADPDTYEQVLDQLAAGYRESYARYECLLNLGVDRGLARDVLGVGVYSTCICTCNPRSLMHFLELRTANPAAKRPSKPLWEIAEAARQLEAIFAKHWPITYDAWREFGRMSP